MKVFQVRFLTVLILFISLLGSTILIPNSLAQEDAQIPDWIKNVAGWWANGEISENEFLAGIEYLINNNIILLDFIPCSIKTESQTISSAKLVPDWVKNNAKWWSEDLIEDTDFVNGIEYLIKKQIISIDNKKILGNVPLEDVTFSSSWQTDKNFLGFSLMQIPAGLLLDKHGPKKVVAYLLLIALVSTISFAFAKSFTGLLISRFFIGVGVAACLMGPLTGYRVWFEDKYQQRANSWMLMVASFGFVISTLPVQILLPVIGWRFIFLLISILILLSIILILVFAPSWNTNIQNQSIQKKGNLSDVWKNKFFISLVPLAFLNYGGVQAIQTLWAGPWMLNVAGYSPLESATGLFWINITMLFAFMFWGYILPKLSSLGIDSIKIVKIGLPISYIILFCIIIMGQKAELLCRHLWWRVFWA